MNRDQMGRKEKRVQLDWSEKMGPQVSMVFQASEAGKENQENKARRASQDERETKVLKGILGRQDLQAKQDPQEIKDQREAEALLDQWDLRAGWGHRENQEYLAIRDTQAPQDPLGRLE